MIAAWTERERARERERERDREGGRSEDLGKYQADRADRNNDQAELR